MRTQKANATATATAHARKGARNGELDAMLVN